MYRQTSKMELFAKIANCCAPLTVTRKASGPCRSMYIREKLAMVELSEHVNVPYTR